MVSQLQDEKVARIHSYWGPGNGLKCLEVKTFGVAINVCSRTEERIRDGLRQSHKRKSGFLKFLFACFFFFFFLSNVFCSGQLGV